MRLAIPTLLALLVFGVTGCDETSTGPRDVTAPAAPRGFYSVTGDGQVTLRWLENTEGDVQGYRLYMAPCASGASCPYDRIGSTSATQFVATGLTNGVTRFYAVAAVDQAGNESALSYETVFDTPRPQGSAFLNNSVNGPANSGWDFSGFVNRAANDPATDIYFGYNGSVYQMFATSHQINAGPPPEYINNDIQDMGFASSLDAVDFSPVGVGTAGGWSPTGTVELIPGHNYVVWTWDDHYAKFRVEGINSTGVGITWAYQTSESNNELKARPARTPSSTPRTLAWLR